MAKDVDLFKAAMAGVTPLKGQRRSVTAKPEPERPAKRQERSLPSAQREKPSTSLAFDREVDRALSRGKRAPEAKLDLHGMTLAAGERAVAAFLAESSEQGRRVVLI